MASKNWRSSVENLVYNSVEFDGIGRNDRFASVGIAFTWQPRVKSGAMNDKSRPTTEVRPDEVEVADCTPATEAETGLTSVVIAGKKRKTRSDKGKKLGRPRAAGAGMPKGKILRPRPLSEADFEPGAYVGPQILHEGRQAPPDPATRNRKIVGTQIAKKRNSRLKLGSASAKQYDRTYVCDYAFEQLKTGRTLASVCEDPGMPTMAMFRTWIELDDPPGIAARYAQARQIGYWLLAEELVALSDKTHEWVVKPKLDADGAPMLDEHGNHIAVKELVPLNSELIAHAKLQIDTRKFMLSKMLPKTFGDKVVQEHTGADGGPIAMAAMNLKGLSDAELAEVTRLLAKAGGSA